MHPAPAGADVPLAARLDVPRRQDRPERLEDRHGARALRLQLPDPVLRRLLPDVDQVPVQVHARPLQRPGLGGAEAGERAQDVEHAQRAGEGEVDPPHIVHPLDEGDRGRVERGAQVPPDGRGQALRRVPGDQAVVLQLGVEPGQAGQHDRGGSTRNTRRRAAPRPSAGARRASPPGAGAGRRSGRRGSSTAAHPGPRPGATSSGGRGSPWRARPAWASSFGSGSTPAWEKASRPSCTSRARRASASERNPPRYCRAPPSRQRMDHDPLRSLRTLPRPQVRGMVAS